MSTRSALVYSCSAMIIFGFWLWYEDGHSRYQVVTVGNMVYIFDHKNAVLNSCNDKNCHMVVPVNPMAAQPVMPATRNSGSLDNTGATGTAMVYNIPAKPGSLTPQGMSVTAPSANPAATVVPVRATGASDDDESGSSSGNTNDDEDDSDGDSQDA